MGTTVFWVAHRKRYTGEARTSALSLRRYNETWERVLFTPEDEPPGEAFDRVVRVARSVDPWYLDSVRIFNQALDHIEADHILYLDTDTLVCGSLGDLVTLLDRFDFVGTHAPGRRTTRTQQPIPPSFPEINVGVLAFRNNRIVRRLFSRWLYWYETYPETYGNNDQGPLRDTLWNWEGKLYVFPPEWNMRYQFGGYARYPVRVLHGRGATEETCQRINRSNDLRGWRRGDIT